VNERRSRKGATRGATLGCSLLVGLALALSPGASAAAPKARPQRPPLASTGGAQHVSGTTAELNGSVNPRGSETSCYFQYGPTTAYGAQTPTIAVGSGTTAIKVGQALSGLQLGTTYHYRLVAASGSAGTSEGQDRTFTTKQIPLKFVLAGTPKVEPYGSPMSLAGVLAGTGAAGRQIVLQANAFPYLGNFYTVGSPISTDATGGFSLPVPRFSQTTELRVGTLATLPIYSQVVTVHVAVRVTLHAKPLGSDGLVRFAGTVAPAVSGAPVVFQLVKANQGFVKVGGATVGGTRGGVARFSAVVKLRRPGAYRALVKVTNGRQVSGNSTSVTVRPAGIPLLKAPRARRRG
jgi:hypothetical protein